MKLRAVVGSLALAVAAAACTGTGATPSGPDTSDDPAAAVCPPVTHDDAFDRFGACMSFDLWQQTGMCGVVVKMSVMGYSADCETAFAELQLDPSPLMLEEIYEMPGVELSAADYVALDAFMNATYDNYLDCSVTCSY